jgi:hypothetical protein
MFEIIGNIIMIPIAIVGYLTLGVCELAYSGDKNVTKEKKFEYLISNTYEIQQDMFYFQWSDTKEWCLDNGCSIFPASVEDFERDPENWMNTDANAQIGHGLKDGWMKEKTVGVVRAGTKITIVKVALRKSLFDGNRYRIHARIEDGPFAGYKPCVSSMFDIYSIQEWDTPKIDEKKLKPISI